MWGVMLFVWFYNKPPCILREVWSAYHNNTLMFLVTTTGGGGKGGGVE